MTISERMRKVRLIEKIENNLEYAERIGVKDVSQYVRLDVTHKAKKKEG